MIIAWMRGNFNRSLNLNAIEFLLGSQGGCHGVPADEFDFDFVGGHNVYSFDDSCDNGIRVFSNMEVGGGQLEIRICSFLLAGSKLVDLLLQAVDFLACVLQLFVEKGRIAFKGQIQQAVKFLPGIRELLL